MLDWQLIFDISPFAWTELGTALLCGFIIGLELVAIKLALLVIAVLVGIDLL
ncbi:hypothetical protein [Rheinheimera maricola]|uniref:NfeD family protein n=1 Tax=Rheinheimera maricola TaxID=2793282 RepID=A0ABS7X699_9GAMM|nr:hypothetical protein [Rheinheimera maricola]MBZ9611059.1 hypothetical protein [Rheinheimera maricola]